MKHSIFTHSLFAVCLLTAGYCSDLAAQAKPADAEAQKIAAAKAAEAEKKAQAEAAKKAEAERRAAQQLRIKTINDTINDMNKRKLSYEARIQELKKFLAQEDYQNCVPSRLRIYNQIIGLCFPPGWTSITLFNYYTADKELIPAVEAIINDKDIPNNDKLYAFEKYVEYLAGKDRHVDAENVAKRCIALFENNPKSLARAYGFLAKAYRYQDRYDDGLKAAREAMKYDKMAGIYIASDLAKAFDKKGDIKTFWKDANVYDKLMYFVNNGIVDSETRNIAYNFAMNEENNIRHRLEIAERYFIGNSEQARTVREKLKGNGKLLNTGIWSHPINNNYRLGGFEMVNDLAGFYAGSSIMNDIRTKRLQVISLGASNREADGAKLAAEFAKDEKISEVDRMRFKFYEAILSGKSTDNLMKNTSLSRKEQSQVYLSAARHCLLWQKSDLAEKYSKIYESFFAEKEVRTIEVKYFEEPVKNITAWRKIYPQLEKQYCDIPYVGSMAFLETDVATGDRGDISIDQNAQKKKYLELTTLSDRYGIHIFLRAEDNNARKIEQGFARGYGCEMYMAPGVNQPYTCMGSDPVQGITFQFHTTYNNLNHTRLPEKDPQRFHSEVEFTDNDYVLHLFFSWDLYYNKLPAKGTDYRFDALAWGPSGGFSWGGSQGIHSAGAWGNLRFNLTDKQLNEIRREIIFKTYKNFRNVPRDPSIRENLFQCWADTGIGDPEFYQKYVLPLENKLNGYVQKINADMTDAEVADVYVNALPQMKGLAYEVDQLRRKYLTEKLLMD